MVRWAGNGQWAFPGTAVPVPPTVVVRDADGNPVAGAQVFFEVPFWGGGGSVTGGEQVTDASGMARVGSWTLGPDPGDNTLEVWANVPQRVTVQFTAAALGGTAGRAAKIVPVEGNSQSATPGTAVAIPPTVQVVDAANRPVAGVEVTFAVTEGGGTLGNATQVTNLSGVASAGSWTLGADVGVNRLEARVAGLGGSPVVFTATVLSPVRVDLFGTAPAIVDRGGTTTLSWATTGAQSVTISGFPDTLPANGSQVVSFLSTTTYTLTATSSDGHTATAQATVVVLPAPGTAVGFPNITAPGAGDKMITPGVTFAWGEVTGAAGYDLRVFDGKNGATIFSGSLAGGDSTSTLISLPDGLYLFAVRACASAPDFGDAGCDSFATRDFTVEAFRPSGAPTIRAPEGGTFLSTPAVTISWIHTETPKGWSQVLVEDLAGGKTAVQGPGGRPVTLYVDESTILSLPSSYLYSVRVRACIQACGEWSTPVTFSVRHNAPPTTSPVVQSVEPFSDSEDETRYTATWTPVAGADFYRYQLVQSDTGPGGGALTVRAEQVSAASTVFVAPPGPASFVVRACTGDGCGPDSAPFPVDLTGPALPTPLMGTPLPGVAVSGPMVTFSWARIGQDSGTTSYRLYVQDLFRESAALDVITTDNFYTAYLKAEGTRYDAIVLSHPETTFESNTVGFIVGETSATAPTMVRPTHQSSVRQGNVQLGWSPVPGATLYEYFVAVLGEPQARVRGVTPGLVVRVPLRALDGQPTLYSGIVRACPAGATCAAGSDAGWGPWSNAAGPGVTNFTVTP